MYSTAQESGMRVAAFPNPNDMDNPKNRHALHAWTSYLAYSSLYGPSVGDVAVDSDAPVFNKKKNNGVI
ncbi:hypothetical protein EJB05_27701, partial [Eragrostis curvula]